MNDKIDVFKLNRNETTFFKGIAILFVLLGHLGYIYKGGAWGVSLFLILSGYGIFQSYKKNNNAAYFSKKIQKIYLPYLLVTIVVLLHYIYISNFNPDKTTILVSLLGLDFNCLYDKTMWYISFIFLQYTVFFISCNISRKLCKKTENVDHMIIAINFIFSVILYNISQNYLIWGQWTGAFLYCYAFSIGLLISKLSSIKINKIIKDTIFNFIIFVIAIILLCLYNNISNDFQYLIYANALPILLVLLHEFKSIKGKHTIINFIGKYSYDIYLWEAFIISYFRQWFPGIKPVLISDICCIIMILLVAYSYNKLIITPTLEFVSEKIEKRRNENYGK